LVFGSMALPGELVRTLVAVLGTALTAYYDLTNNKNIPNNVLYGFLAIAILLNAIFFNLEILLFGLGLAILISILGYLMYKTGQLGAADVFVFASIALALPIPPSFAKLPFNFPFIALVFVFSSLVFALFTIYYFGSKLIGNKKAKPKKIYLLLLLPWFVFVYLFLNSVVFSSIYFVIISVAYLSSIFVMTYRESINRGLYEKVGVKKLMEEDVLATEFMDAKFVKKYKLDKVLDAKMISRLKRGKVKDVLVYTKLPPFLPFVLLGVLMALLFGKMLVLSF
jgi:Flp pilus assembly protein protease CpaA